MPVTIRRQLTLFVSEADAVAIEAIRTRYNPQQRELINCHVTLCREDEIADIEKVLENLANLTQKTIKIRFEKAKRFDNGKGVLLIAAKPNEQFQLLRQQVLKGLPGTPGKHEAHITLMHPRNSTCTDTDFAAIQQANLPTQLRFNTISLIEQAGGERWKIIRTFYLR